MKLFLFSNLLSLCLFFSVPHCFSISSSKVDSLQNILKTAEGQMRVDVLNRLSEAYRMESNEKAMEYAHQALLSARKINYRTGEASALNYIGLAYAAVSNLKKEKEYYEQALLIWEELGDKKGMAKVLNNIGLVYYYQGDNEKAVSLCLRSLQIHEEINNEDGVGNTLVSLGTIYLNQGHFNKAREFFLKALEYNKRKGDKLTIAGISNNIGNSYNYQKNHELAIKYYNMAATLLEEIGAKGILAIPLNNIGTIKYEQKDYEAALSYYSRSLGLREEVGDLLGKASSLGNVGDVFAAQGEFNKALEYQYESLEIAKSLGAKHQMLATYESLALTYSKSNDYKQAYVFHQLFAQIKDSIFTEESSNQIAEMQTIYESDKKEKEIVLLTREKEAQDLALKKNRILMYAFSGGLVLVLMLAAVIFTGFRQKRKANNLLENQNSEINLQKEIIEEKNKGITDSIRYAKRIQEVMLLPFENVKQHLPESFILYLPKDIVSGDFYWVSPQQSFQGEVILIGAVDCTGHGVPGAFMSIVGHNGLNQSVKEQKLTQPAEILNFLDKSVSETMHSKKQESGLRDGMDIALCALDKASLKLQYAGANNPLWIIRHNKKDQEGGLKYPGLLEIKADKKPIGSYFDGASKPFTNHAIQLDKGDTFYIFSDGYADQFGGEKGKKLMSARFAELLVSISSLPMPEQQEVLKIRLEEWKGKLEQVDDILVIGVRV